MMSNLKAEIEAMDAFEYLSSSELYIDGYANAKWYDWEEDMRILSSRFPEVTFTLHGSGEDSNDIWTCYFRNGNSSGNATEIRTSPITDYDIELMRSNPVSTANYSYQSGERKFFTSVPEQQVKVKLNTDKLDAYIQEIGGGDKYVCV